MSTEPMRSILAPKREENGKPTITIHDLTRFTETENEARREISKVYHDGMHSWATDGCILVRIPSKEPESEDPKGMVAKFHEVYAKAWLRISRESDGWEPLAIGPAVLVPGTECEATGNAKKCPSCDGWGEVTFDHDYSHKGISKTDEYEIECKLCDGSGKLEDDHGHCQECHGQGNIVQEDWIDVVGSRFSGKLIRRLLSLPNPMIHSRADAWHFYAHPVRGEGWTGVLMPMRKDS